MALQCEGIKKTSRNVFSLIVRFDFSFLIYLYLFPGNRWLTVNEINRNLHPGTVGLNESWHKIELIFDSLFRSAYCTSSVSFSSWRSHANKTDNTYILNDRYNKGLSSLEKQTCFTLTHLDALELDEKQSLLIHFYCQNSGYYTTDHLVASSCNSSDICKLHFQSLMHLFKLN